MALLVVWVLVVGLVVTLGTVFYRHQLAVARLATHTQNDQAILLALGVENWAGSMLAGQYDDAAVDHLLENWAQPVPPLPVEGGYISGCLVDLQGLFNLNSLSLYESTTFAAELEASDEDGQAQSGAATTFLDLLTSLGLPSNPGMAGVLADWTDGNTQALSDWASGEQVAYDAARQRVMVPDSVIVETAELGLLAGFDRLTVEALMPWVSALPVPTPVNINTAPEPVLRALGVERGQEFAAWVMQSRPFNSTAAFRQQVAGLYGIEAEEAEQRWPDQRIAVASDFFALQLKVSLGTVELEISSVLDRRAANSPAAIRRTVNRVPRIDRQALDEDELALLADPCTGLVPA